MAVFGLELPENELDVSQTQGRLLLHAFGAAAAYAQRIYGVRMIISFICEDHNLTGSIRARRRE